MNRLAVSVVLLTICAESSDVGSLMQVGVASESRTGAQAVFDSVQQELANLPFSNPGDQLAITTLLSGIDLDQTPLYKNQSAWNLILSLLAEMLDDFMTAKYFVDNQTEKLRQDYHNCQAFSNNTNNTKYTDVVSKTNDFVADSDTHFQCRQDEEGKFDEDAQSCGKLVWWMHTQTKPLYCTDRVNLNEINDLTTSWWNDKIKRSEYLAMVDGARHTAITQSSELAGYKDECLTDTKALEDQIALCDGKQFDSENSWCNYKDAHAAWCQHTAECHTDHKKLYDDHEAVETNISILRQKEAATVEHIECLIFEIMNETYNVNNCTLDITRFPIMDASDPLYKYLNHFPALPDAPACPVMTYQQDRKYLQVSPKTPTTTIHECV